MWPAVRAQHHHQHLYLPNPPILSPCLPSSLAGREAGLAEVDVKVVSDRVPSITEPPWPALSVVVSSVGEAQQSCQAVALCPAACLARPAARPSTD